MATSFYKICGTQVYGSAPRLVNSLLFLKLIFVYYSLFYFGVYNR
ncbi:recombinase RecF [Rickettsia sp. R2]